MTDIPLVEVVAHFDLPGDYRSAAPYGTGHINDTYAVTVDQGGTTIRYILQRLNRKVFRDPEAVMENIERVTLQVRRILREESASDISRRTLTLVPSRSGRSYWLDGEGYHWRTYIFIEKARTYDALEEPGQAYQAARAFGRFQRQLADLEGGPLRETIPDFHSGPKRFRDFQGALAGDAYNRAVEASREIEYLQHRAWIFDVLPEEVEAGRIPIRSTHNDTKINNVMIDDQTGEGICVIDLDTLMPGLALYDFGDMVRTSTCRAAEDEQDLNRVAVDAGMFDQVARGYLSEASGFLTEAERRHLLLAGKMITLIIGCRFLTDFLNGDTYFKTQRKGQNLDRARTQFRLVESMFEQEEQLQAIIDGVQT